MRRDQVDVTVIPAQPGYYVEGGHKGKVERFPLVAWRVVTVVPWDEEQECLAPWRLESTEVPLYIEPGGPTYLLEPETEGPAQWSVVKPPLYDHVQEDQNP